MNGDRLVTIRRLVTLGWEAGGLEGAKRGLSGVLTMLFHTFICTLATCFYIYVNNNPFIPVTLLNFTIFKLYPIY